jgi:membrane-associated phospholipid phosphatase
VGAGRAWLGVGLGFLAGFLLLTALVTQRGFDRADRLARSLVHQSRHPGLQGVMEGASWLGGQPGQVAVVVAGSVILWSRRRRWALALPLVMAGVGVVQLLAKRAVDRPRPNLDAWGFPSAHVLSLVVLLGCLAYLTSRARTRRPWHRLAVGASVGVVGLVAHSRMYLDAHWLSDVLGGLVAGLAYVLVAIWMIERAPRRGRPRPSEPRASLARGGLVPAAPGPAADPLSAAGVAGVPPAPIPDPG